MSSPSDRRTIWKRRIMLMAVVALLVAVPATLLLRDEGGRGGPEVPAVGKRKVDKGLDLAFRVPENWKRKRTDGVLSLRSRNRRAVVAISAPGPRSDADVIYKEALSGLRKQYRRVRVLDELRRKKLGGRPARSAAIAAEQGKRKPALRILLSVAKGRKKAYLVEVFASAADRGKALVEAQALLGTLRFRG